MTDSFTAPDVEDLEDAGVIAPDELSAEVEEDVALPDGFRKRWKALVEMGSEDILALARDEYLDRPGAFRGILATLIAQQLGYRKVLRRRVTLEMGPLWDLLDAETFSSLDEVGIAALVEIAESTRVGRPALHPMAALAALVLERHGGSDARDIAHDILEARALPDEPDWLYQLIRESSDDELRGLVELELEHRYWEVAALMIGLRLVSEYAPSYAGSPAANLLAGCDRAAEQHYKEAEVWLQLLADAAMGGQLTHPWLERPIQAAIRLSIDERGRELELRDYHGKRCYDAGHQRLQDIYEGQLGAYSTDDEVVRGHAERTLLREVEITRHHNPARAQKLLELMVMQRHRARVGSLQSRMRRAMTALADTGNLSPPERQLIELYVSNYEIEPYAAKLVRATADKIDWEVEGAPGSDTLDMYLMVSDYERAFEHLTCKFDGVTLEHADKDAALRVKTFVEKRLDPSSITRLMRTLFTPIEWVGSSIADIDIVAQTVDRAVRIFEQRVRTTDLRGEVVEEFGELGAEVTGFGDIAELKTTQIDQLLQKRRTRRMLLGAFAGGISGGLAPFSWSALSMADVPILLGITADVCSRFCWYFGFDPRENPELPMEILAVALGGSRPAAIEPMLLRQNLREYAVHKSLMVGAVAHGTVTQMAGRALGTVVQQQAGDQAARRVMDLAKKAVSRNLRRRAAESVTSKTLPVLGAMLGASLNVALVYDVCEAAQAVLTDRFLERKYPDWIRKFGALEEMRDTE
ncbi:MAG: EcsC family protein [Myxococcota bacterium]